MVSSHIYTYIGAKRSKNLEIRPKFEQNWEKLHILASWVISKFLEILAPIFVQIWFKTILQTKNQGSKRYYVDSNLSDLPKMQEYAIFNRLL